MVASGSVGTVAASAETAPPATLPPVTLDAIIIGGGIAGLWTLRTLLAEGYDAALVETGSLGHGQTIASQGILHAGTKYALTGHAAGASRAAAEGAAVWRACLASRGPLDLAPVRVLSRKTHLFTTPGVGSRLTGLAASKALAVGPRKLARAEFPGAFAGAPHGVDVYELDEPVLDGGSVIETVAAPARDRLILAHEVALEQGGGGVVIRLSTDGVGAGLEARAAVLAAGAGNEALLSQLGLAADIRMQRRPLHMVLARFGAGTSGIQPQAPGLSPLFAHCVSLSDKPRATITTATDRAGRTVWYIGGQIAESGVGRSRDDQIGAARRELREILPWIDLAGTQWATLMIDRAEGFSADGTRPDTPVVRAAGGVVACWPTKLVLAPLAAGRVLEAVRSIVGAPSGAASELRGFARPPVALAPWDREGVVWS